MSPLETIHSLFRELFGWEGDQLLPVDFVIASYLAPFLCGAVEKPWGCLVGAPSTGKTEIIHSFRDGNKRTIVVDAITENAFSSAYRDEENPKDISLAKRLSNEVPPVGQKCLMVKDLTTILSTRQEKINTFFGELRSAYDGGLAKAAGNVGIDDKGTLGFGFVAACTYVLDDIRRKGQALGERILVCRMGNEYSTYEGTWNALKRMKKMPRTKKAELKKKLNETMVQLVREAMVVAVNPETKITASNELLAKVDKLALIASRIRVCPVSAHTYSPTGEGPWRILGQVNSWGDALCIFDKRKEWNESDYNLIRRICRDTVDPGHLRALVVLWRGSARESLAPMKQEDIRFLSTNGEGLYRQLRQWVMIGNLVEHSEGMYGLHPRLAQHIEETGFLEVNYAS